MEFTELSDLIDLSDRRKRDVPMTFQRSLLQKIDWRDRLIGIKGARGTGKTTLMLQRIKTAFSGPEALYISLDNLWFETHSLADVIEYHLENGGTHLFIDEIHYCDQWQTLLKNVNDNYPALHIVYSGSSILKMEQARGDLSRRQITYLLPGLSFREYLSYEHGQVFDVVSLETLLKNHVEIAQDITGQLKVIPAFKHYLQKGYYPFYKDVFGGYETRIIQVVNQVLESDYPAVEEVTYATVKKARRMLMILAENAPQTPNMKKLYAELETDRNQGLKMLYALERADLLQLLSTEKRSLKNMSRPDKIYCNNPNLMYALVKQANTGCVRETFFLNQLRAAGYDVCFPVSGDFSVDGRFLFEIGGRKKTFDQIRDIPDSFLACDDMEIGRGNRIPLWMFGLLY